MSILSWLTKPSTQLRNKIYHYLFVLEDDHIDLDNGRIMDVEDYFTPPEVLARVRKYQTTADASSQLLYKSKQIYHEAAAILYANNIFHITQQETLYRVADKIGKFAVVVKGMTIYHSGSSTSWVYNSYTLGNFSGLRELSFTTRSSIHLEETFDLPTWRSSRGRKGSRQSIPTPAKIPAEFLHGSCELLPKIRTARRAA